MFSMTSSSGFASDTPAANNKGYFKPTGHSIDIGWQWNSYKDKSKRKKKEE